MRQYIAAVFFLFFSVSTWAEVLSVDPEATPKPLKVMVEGLPDAKPTSLTTQKEVFFKNELFKANTRNSVARIKTLADKNPLEGEVIDAIISKLSDMEDEAKRQKMTNIGLVCVMIGLLIIVITQRRK